MIKDNEVLLICYNSYQNDKSDKRIYQEMDGYDLEL